MPSSVPCTRKPSCSSTNSTSACSDCTASPSTSTCPSTTQSSRRSPQQRFTRSENTARTVRVTERDLPHPPVVGLSQPQAPRAAEEHQQSLVGQAGQASRAYRDQSPCQSGLRTSSLSGPPLKEPPPLVGAQTLQRQP